MKKNTTAGRARIAEIVRAYVSANGAKNLRVIAAHVKNEIGYAPSIATIALALRDCGYRINNNVTRWVLNDDTD